MTSHSSAEVVIVTGLPRSGTSLVMRMLETAGFPLVTDQQRLADSDNPHGYFEHERIKSLSRDSTWLASLRGQAVKIVIPLVRCVPRELSAAVIHLERPLEEIFASQRRMLAHRGKSPAASDEFLTPVYLRLLRETEEFLLSSGFRLLRLPYHDLVQNPAATTRRLAEFLHLPEAAESMQSCIDPALHRNRQSAQGPS